MDKSKQNRSRRLAAHARVRRTVGGTPERPRLAVYKSARHIYAQVIDDEAGHTLAQASSVDGDLKKKVSGKAPKEAARLIGEMVAERAKKQGIEKVVFDRGGYLYHGRVKELAEGARDKGLSF